MPSPTPLFIRLFRLSHTVDSELRRLNKKLNNKLSYEHLNTFLLGWVKCIDNNK